jgi:hypothetical protein
MSLVETKKIKAPFESGFALINAADFDPAQHELFEPEPKAAKQPKAAKAE